MSPSTLTSMSNLATVLSCQGKYEQAEEMHRQALGLRETVLSKEQPEKVLSAERRASLHVDQRQQSGLGASRSGQIRGGGGDESLLSKSRGQ
jgi:hypothetical protein